MQIPDHVVSLLRAVRRLGQCRRRQVGCVLTDAHGTVVGIGWNALPGPESCLAGACPRGLLSYAQAPAGRGYAATGCQAVHAEARALRQTLLTDAPVHAYVTCEPCVDCAKLLDEHGIRWTVLTVTDICCAIVNEVPTH